MLLDAIEIETGPNPSASIVWLHGLGADGGDFAPLARELQLGAVGSVRYVFPHAPMMPVTIGMAFGLFSTSLGLVSLPAPWIGAQLWERFSPQFPFTITAIAILLSIIPIWLKFKPPQKEEQLEESAIATAS